LSASVVGPFKAYSRSAWCPACRRGLLAFFVWIIVLKPKTLKLFSL